MNSLPSASLVLKHEAEFAVFPQYHLIFNSPMLLQQHWWLDTIRLVAAMTIGSAIWSAFIGR